MSMHRWYLGFAIGLALIASLGHAKGADHAEPREGKSDSSANISSLEPGPASVKDIYVYPYSCERPKDAEQDNLCIERRSARADEDAAYWTQATFWLGALGTIAVALTLGANTWATWLMHRDFVANNRPRVRFISAKPLEMENGKPVAMSVRIGNVGATSATISKMHFDCFSYTGEGPVLKPETKLKPVKKFKLKPSQQYEFTAYCPTFLSKDEIEEILSGERRLFFSGLIFYSDSIRVSRVTSVLREYDHLIKRIKDVADEENDFEL